MKMRFIIVHFAANEAYRKQKKRYIVVLGGVEMSIITELERHVGIVETTLNGVITSTATYEVVDGVLIVRTTTHDTIHITPEIGEKLVSIINRELLNDRSSLKEVTR